MYFPIFYRLAVTVVLLTLASRISGIFTGKIPGRGPCFKDWLGRVLKIPAGTGMSEIPMDSGNSILILDEQDMEDLMSLLGNSKNIWLTSAQAFFKHFPGDADDTTKNIHNMVIDSGEESRILTEMVGNRSLEFAGHTWLFCHSPSNMGLISRLRSSLNYGSKVFTLEQAPAALTVHEHYAISKGSLISNIVEVWSNSEVLQRSPFIWDRRADLQGHQLRVSVLHYPPWSIVNDPRDLTQNTGHGPELMKLFVDHFNFTMDLRLEDSFGKTRKGAPEHFSGVLGRLQRGEADLAGHVVTVTLDRLKAVDFTQVLYDYQMVFCTKRNSAGVGQKISFLALLDTNLWLCLFTTIATIMVVGILGTLRTNGQEVDIPATALGIFGTFVGQGSEDPVKTGSGSLRTLKLTALLFGFFAMQVLSARLASFLAIERMEPRIRGIQDIEDLGLNLYLVGGTSALEPFLLADKSEIYGRLYENQIKTDPRFTDTSLDSVLENFHQDELGVVQIDQTQIANWMMGHRKFGCNMDIVPVQIPYFNGMATIKRFPFMEAFNYKLTKLRESGILAKLERKWAESIFNSRDYICSDQDGLSSVRFVTMIKVFGVLAFGIVSGVILGVLEYFHCQQRKTGLTPF